MTMTRELSCMPCTAIRWRGSCGQVMWLHGVVLEGMSL
jgi:hypothetical protein